MPRSGELDLVVYGATGFTGRLVAERLAEVKSSYTATFARELPWRVRRAN